VLKLAILELFSLAGRVAIVTGGKLHFGLRLGRGLIGARHHLLTANCDAERGAAAASASAEWDETLSLSRSTRVTERPARGWRPSRPINGAGSSGGSLVMR